MKTVFGGFISRLNLIGMDSVNLEVCQQKLLKLKSTPYSTAGNQRQRETLEINQRFYFTHRSTRVRILSDVSFESIQARREWSEIIKILKEIATPNQNSVSTDIILLSERDISTFSDKQKLTELAAGGPALQEMLKEGFQCQEIYRSEICNYIREETYKRGNKSR